MATSPRPPASSTLRLPAATPPSRPWPQCPPAHALSLYLRLTAAGDPSLRPDNFVYSFTVFAGGGSPIPVVSGFQGDAFIGSALVGFYLNFSEVFSESKMSRFAGSCVGGFSDGDAASAKLDRPLRFAVDSRGNVYVADQMNHAIKKISSSGGG